MPIPKSLIADDQPDVLAALRLLLKGAGYHTESANSPETIISAIKASDFDVVLMDLNYARDTTSGREGLDLISRIKAEDNSLPIVVMTAWGSVDLAVEAMRCGVCDFVEKPWDNSRLLGVLRTQVEQGRARRCLRHKAAQRRALNRRLKSELREALEIQKQLMPPGTVRLDGFDVSCAWRSARTIGGDYLAVFPLGDEKAVLCVADVSGKGVPAALMMSNLHAALKSAAAADIMPKQLCAQMNSLICGNIPLNRFISCFYGLLDVRRRVLKFTNAGHNAPLLARRTGEVVRLKTGGRVLGVLADSNYQQAELELRSGDRLLLFTDGITEVRNASGEEFSEARLRDLLARERRHSAARLQSIIMDQVKGFCGNQFDDDAALMIVEVK